MHGFILEMEGDIAICSVDSGIRHKTTKQAILHRLCFFSINLEVQSPNPAGYNTVEGKCMTVWLILPVILLVILPETGRYLWLEGAIRARQSDDLGIDNSLSAGRYERGYLGMFSLRFAFLSKT